MKIPKNMKLIATPSTDPSYPGFYIDLQVGGNTYSVALVEINGPEDRVSVAVWTDGIAGDSQDPTHIIKSDYKVSDLKPKKVRTKEFRRFTPIPLDVASGDWTKIDDDLRSNEEQIAAIDKEQKEKNTILGRFFSTPVADGRAVYQITAISENKRSAYIEVCTGLGDDWQSPLFGIEGWFPYQVIQEEIRRKDALADLFAKGK